MDSPSTQIALDLCAAVTKEISQRRPILHRLNNDTSFLLQLPRAAAAASKPGSKVFYNILVDPWLTGGQSDTAGWFTQQWHTARSAVQSVSEINVLAREIENLASKQQPNSCYDAFHKKTYRTDLSSVSEVNETMIDVVVISHEFTDHCHKNTLMTLDRDVPIFAPEVAALEIKTWSYFRTVCSIPVYSRSTRSLDWHTTSIPPLPEWFGIGRIEVPDDPLAYHSALLLAFDALLVESSTTDTNSKSNSFTRTDEDSSAHVILYTPHGTPADVVKKHIAFAMPPLRLLALLHGLHKVYSREHVYHLGGFNALDVQTAHKAKYWIPTHDELKIGTGAFLSKFSIKRKAYTVREILQHEEQIGGSSIASFSYRQLLNGESILLEP